MNKETPILDRIYYWPEYTAVARAIGYRGVVYRDLGQLIEDLAKQFSKAKVESAIYHLTTFEGQMTVKPPPLAQVTFREHVRPLLWQLLGPPPESWDDFYKNVVNPPPNPYVKAPEPPKESPLPKADAATPTTPQEAKSEEPKKRTRKKKG